MNAPEVPVLTMEAFVAPANFDPDAQEVNIVAIFNEKYALNSEAIFSIGSGVSVTSIYYLNKYLMCQTVNGENQITDLPIGSSTFEWTNGSTKRYGVLQSPSYYTFTPDGAIWAYFGSLAKTIAMCSPSFQNNSAKYCHYSSALNITSISYCAFQGCRKIEGVLNIPSTVNSIGDLAFIVCYSIEKIVCKAVIPPTTFGDTFYGIRGIPLHVPVGSLAAYQAAQYWSQFTNIIADL